MSQLRNQLNAFQVKSTCPYCGVGCGVIATSDANEQVSIKGDPDHPANKGILCSKGMALSQTLGHNDRLLVPNVDGVDASWAVAISKVANGFKQTVKQYGADSVAFYVSGQLLTEDYYVANKLMKGFIGSANIDTNSRLCMSSAVAGYKRAFGGDIVPGNYEDWDKTDLAIIVGSNAAWCHPILFNRLIKAQKTRGTKMVIIDPRRTASCDTANLHLPIKPGTDVILFNGLLVYLAGKNAIDNEYVKLHTLNIDQTLDAARADAPDIHTVAKKCMLDVTKVAEFYELFLTTKRSLTLYSMGVNQSSSGTDKTNAIINCHLYTGRIGKQGMGPFSITGQPNAMGGREVGGLANMLAAHMDFTPKTIDLVSRFWGATNIAKNAGAKAVDMFDKINSGKIKAIWIMATNPAVSMPDSNMVRAALKKCPLVVVSDCMNNTDTMAYANIKLPAMAWGEKNGTVTNSERCITRQRNFLKPAGQAKADWWIICQVAKKMGFEKQFNYNDAADIFKEHSQLSDFENGGETRRAFNIGLHANIHRQQYDNLAPTQWPITQESPNGTSRMLNDASFYTPNQKANFVKVSYKPPLHKLTKAFPLILNSGRLRDQWHTMSRTGKSAKLNNKHAEPLDTISARLAKTYNIMDNDFVEISSQWGKALVRAYLEDDQPDQQIFMPIHWTNTHASAAVTGQLVNPVVDPVSGQPELKHTPVSIKPWLPEWHGFLIGCKKYDVKALNADKNIKYWAYNYQDNCHILNLAGYGKIADLKIIKKTNKSNNLLSYIDNEQGQYRYANIENNKLKTCLMVTDLGELPPLQWLQYIMNKQIKVDDKSSFLLSGTSLEKRADLGPIICSCIGVYKKQMTDAILEHKLTTTEQVGQLLKAGTNCGSCLSEINLLLKPQFNDA